LYNTIALRSDGLVFTVGRNNYGECGVNSATNISTFVQAIGISNAKAVAGGWYHCVALRIDGTVFAAGANTYGALGDATVTSRSTFVQAISMSSVVAIAAGSSHTMAIRSDGLVFACGYGLYGQIGNNTSSMSTVTFVQAIGISNAVAVSGGFSHSVALRADGLVYTCGRNAEGQLGNNTTTSCSTYIQAIGISNAIAVAAENNSTMALRADGLVFTCGYNTTYGQLGDNSVTNRSTFVQVVGISNAIAISSGETHSVVLRSDGMVLASGQNNFGAVGDNSTTNRSTFVQALWP
jgi:alpha-tubulin suppressor-like RCC1 family protein